MAQFRCRDRTSLNFGSGAQAALIAMACVGVAPAAAQTIPTDPSPTCTVPAPTFASWFQSGTPAVNGVVNPANSVAFPNSPNCSFYQWSEQMFLWATSPAPPVYGGGDRIFDSATFFDVSPPDSMGNRTLLPHSPGFLHLFGVRAAQLGPHGLPVIFAKSGQMLEIERPQTVVSAQLRVREANGNLVDVAHAERAENGALILRDKAGAIIQMNPVAATRPIFRASPLGVVQVQKFIVDNLPVFIDPFGAVIEVEQGQADGSVLEAQTNSLIYYGIMVNDVYAYFLTGLKDGIIEPGNLNPTFPTSMSDLSAITTFAGSHGKTFVDSDALAVEIKTSWVEASTLPNANAYITVAASVPIYNTSNPNLWTPTGTKTTTLALVGVHIVGSTAGHPEMIWASFEHVGNTPNPTFQYINSLGTLTTVPQSTSGNWLFSKSGSAGPFDASHMQQSGANIQAISPFNISPSDTIRWKPWGAASDLSPNPIDGSAAASNTEIIAINNSVRGMLPSGDVRDNYFMLGATWTIFGAAPLPQFGAPTPADPGNQVGTSRLANTTMETYQQGSDTTSTGGSNCFSCHASINPTIATTAVSHIFGAIKPLF
jgi:hypothetical protein